MEFRNILNRLTLIETDNVIQFPKQGVKKSYSQVLDAAPEEFQQVINIAKIYKNHKDLWFKNKKPLDREIALQALESLSKWSDYFGYEEVADMLAVLQYEKLI